MKRPSNLPIDAIQTNKPLDGLEQAFRSDSPLRIENRSLEVAVATGAPISETANKVANGDNSPVVTAKAVNGDTVGDAVKSAIASNTPVEEAAVVVADAQQKKSDIQAFSDYTLEGSMTEGDPNFNPAMARFATNQQILIEAIEGRFKDANQDKSTAGYITDFIDRYFIRQIGIGTFEDLWEGRTEARGLSLAQAQASMSPDEFAEYADGIAQGLAEEGFFKGDNYFAMQQGLGEALNAGYDPTGAALETLSVLDFTVVGALPKALGKGSRLLGRVSKMRGIKAVDEAAEQIIKTGGDQVPEVADELLPAHLQLGKMDDVIVPTQNKVQKAYENNAIIKEVQDLWNKGSFGRAATSDQIAVVASRISSNLEAISSRPLASTNVVDMGLGQSALSAKFGKIKDGMPFQTKASADKFAKSLQEKGLSARTVQVDPDDVKQGFYTEVLERMDLSKTADPINIEAAFGNMLQNATRGLASAASTDDPFLATLANLGESGAAAVGDIVKKDLLTIAKLPLDRKQALDGVMRELRDGADSFMREAYTEADFRVKFAMNHPTGKQATDADVEAYFKMQSMNDAAYVIEANNLVKKYVVKGFKAIDINGVNTPAKKFDGVVAGDTPVLDASTGRMVTKADLADGEALWKLERAEQGIEYVSRPKNVRELDYADVLPYNAGGRRINPDARYFVTSGRGNGRALFTAFTEKQAKLGAKQVGEIFRVAKATGRKLDELTDELDDVIRRNNDWNPSIENTRELIELAARKGWDELDVISYKARDGIVEAGPDEIANGMSYGEYTMSARRRADDVLMEFGGNEVNNHSPIQAIASQLSSSSQSMAMSNYSNASKAAWLKKSMRTSELPDGMDVNRAFYEAGEMKGAGQTDRRLNDLRGVIERREGVKGQISQAAENLGTSIREFVFDTTGSKKGQVAEGAEGALLNFGFHSAFTGNPSQLFLQATHAPIIIAASPKHGGKGAAVAAALALIRMAPVKSQSLAMKRAAAFFGFDPKEFDEIAEYMRTSGRQNIEMDTIERGVGDGFGLDGISRTGQVVGATKRGLNHLLLPFNIGEAASRQTGMLTAILEYKAKYPKASLFGDDARFAITRREQDLTFNMTTTSRAKWQHGVMKVPTQWMSYMLRTMEAIVLGKGFTPAERARMALVMASGGGVAGLGLSESADWIGEKLGVEPDSIAFNTIKNGVYDGILSWGLSEMTDTEVRTAMGSRIGPLAGLVDIKEKLDGTRGDSLVSVIGGPSGEMAAGTVKAVVATASAILDGNWQTAKDDVSRVLRQPSALDNVAKAYGIANYGMYRSKTGTVLPVDMDRGWGSADTLLALTGVTNNKVAEFYDQRSQAFTRTSKVQAFQKEVLKDFRRGLFISKTDPEAGMQMLKEVEARIATSGFSPYDIHMMRRSLKDNLKSEINMMALEELRRGDDFTAKIIEGLND